MGPNSMVARFCTGAALVTLGGLAVTVMLRHFASLRRDIDGPAGPPPRAPARNSGNVLEYRTKGSAASVLRFRHAPRYAGGLAALVLVSFTFVYWNAHVEQCKDFWVRPAQVFAHGELAQSWQWVCDNLPPTEPLAYTNTFMVHSLTGFTHARPVVYVPTRRGVAHIRDMPHLPGRLSGEALEPAFVATMVGETDADGWLAKLKASGATHLLVAKPHPPAGTTPPPLGDKAPPELAIIRAHPERFEPVFDNPAATVYRLK